MIGSRMIVSPGRFFCSSVLARKEITRGKETQRDAARKQTCRSHLNWKGASDEGSKGKYEALKLTDRTSLREEHAIKYREEEECRTRVTDCMNSFCFGKEALDL